MFKRVLLVDPDPAVRANLRHVLLDLAMVEAVADFPTARKCLFDSRPDLLVTNIRLREFNGLHLVHLAAAAALPTRSVVYGDQQDLGLAREAQAIGAFFEFGDRLSVALAGIVKSTLPLSDRREVDVTGRRVVFRGGRRSTDVPPDEVSLQPSLL